MKRSQITLHPIAHHPFAGHPFARLAALLALAWLAGTVQAQEAEPAPQWRDGKQVYDKVCGHCHKAAVGVGTLLEGRELPLDYLKVIVRSGFNAMPAFPASHVDDRSLAEVSKYLASLPPPPPATPAGKQP